MMDGRGCLRGLQWGVAVVAWHQFGGPASGPVCTILYPLHHPLLDHHLPGSLCDPPRIARAFAIVYYRVVAAPEVSPSDLCVTVVSDLSVLQCHCSKRFRLLRSCVVLCARVPVLIAQSLPAQAGECLALLLSQPEAGVEASCHGKTPEQWARTRGHTHLADAIAIEVLSLSWSLSWSWSLSLSLFGELESDFEHIRVCVLVYVCVRGPQW
jgi:hypothetical protein